MSEDLIRRSDAIDELMYTIPYKRYHNGEYVFLLDKRECLAAIKAMPSADRPQGEWIALDDTSNGYWKCSACGQASEASVAGILYKFCPFCGADMRKGIDDE